MKKFIRIAAIALATALASATVHAQGNPHIGFEVVPLTLASQ